MKKIICFLMILVLICSLLPVYSLGAEGMTMVVDPADAVEVDTDRLLQAASAKRAKVGDNLVFPGPLVQKCSFVSVKGNVELPLGVICTGKTNQYMCMMIYAGSEPTGEPVASDYRLFDFSPGSGMGVGFDTFELYWRMNSAPTGQYTLVTFTAVEENDTLYAVDGTVFMTDIYVTDSYIKREQSFVMYDDAWEELDVIRLPIGETTVLAAGRSPVPSYGIDKLSMTCPGMLRCEDAGGYFFVTPIYVGSDSVWFQYGHLDDGYYIPVEVCYSDSGHSFLDSIPSRSPTEDEFGYDLQVCEYCNTVAKSKIPTLSETFAAFRDIPSDAWYHSSVKEAVIRRLFNGVNANSFGPDDPMTRAMLVTVLWRYEGEPEAASANFVDVKAGEWYAGAVNWAAEQGIVNGIGKGKFDPNGTITREQMATILYRYALQKGLDSSQMGDPASFPDGSELSSWAQEGMSWALGQGLISGVGKGGKIYLTPKGNATRAQVAAILVRYIENLVEAPVYPDLTTAVDGGVFSTREGEELLWAFYDSGLLQIGGKSNLAHTSPEKMPWYPYRDQITEIQFLYGITHISAVFKEYPALETVIMADSIGLVWEEAFYNCPKLSNIQFSANLSSIQANAFRQCESLKEISIPDTAPLYVYPYAFADNPALETVILGNSVRRIMDHAFENCTALKEITLPNSILDFIGSSSSQTYYGVEGYAFSGCTSLEAVTLPVGLQTLNSHVFYGCESLKYVETSFALEVIYDGAFGECSSLESLALPPSLRSIGKDVFAGCTSLKELYLLNFTLATKELDPETVLDKSSLPLGDPDHVVIYGFLNSSVQNTAEKYGYEFRDIMEVLTP